jgi:hypothetical protein
MGIWASHAKLRRSADVNEVGARSRIPSEARDLIACLARFPIKPHHYQISASCDNEGDRVKAKNFADLVGFELEAYTRRLSRSRNPERAQESNDRT